MTCRRSQASPWQLPAAKEACTSSSSSSNDIFPKLPRNPPSSEDDNSSGSDGGDEHHRFAQIDSLESSIFQGYEEAGNTHHANADPLSSKPAIAKIRDLLVASKLKTMSCLICLEKVRVSDPVWHCTEGCYAIYHLICIQAWAGEACKVAEDRARARLSREHFPAAEVGVSWNCPKCRIEYSRARIPRESLCYCGKAVNPPVDPWLTAHSCGQICGRDLANGCGHECKLLCHPGPCPPCPQFVRTVCFCGACSDVRRCGHKHFSCGSKCSKKLACGLHTCQEVCHDAECPPCEESGTHRCRCGRREEVRACFVSNFGCDEPCGKMLQCKKHWCKKVCHQGPCGECELQGRQKCPCGKIAYKELACDAAAPTCGSTCEKLLPCLIHRCQERCHTGDCKTICRIVTLKVCRCGSLRKEIPCHQDLQCERKCQLLRDCKRHPCKRRCCNGDCPPCSEICGKKLRCGNHKCPSPCHRGPCAPCPVSIRISCACGSTAYEVPCGAERDKRPPRCSRPCSILPRCHHKENYKQHRCHYGACPQCALVCDDKLSCGHSCKERCHGPRPQPNPDFKLRQTKKRKEPNRDTELLGLPCPPCTERIVRRCLGCHSGEERTVMCSASSPFCCGKLCGNFLACGNHTCQKPCHEVTIRRIPGFKTEVEKNLVEHDSCEECARTCQKVRIPACSHPCMQQCHVGDCSPCNAPLKKACHCGTLTQTFSCSVFNSFGQQELATKLSCGGPCHRKLPNCAHLCSEVCHPGPCKTSADCQKKVSVWCRCQRLKKEWRCSDVQMASAKLNLSHHRGPIGVGLLSCDEDCLKLAKQQNAKEELEGLHQRTLVSSEDPPKRPGKRRHHRSSSRTVSHSKIKVIYQSTLKWIIVVLMVLLVAAVIYYGIQALYALSDWMNEREARRSRKRHGTRFTTY